MVAKIALVASAAPELLGVTFQAVYCCCTSRCHFLFRSTAVSVSWQPMLRASDESSTISTC